MAAGLVLLGACGSGNASSSGPSPTASAAKPGAPTAAGTAGTAAATAAGTAVTAPAILRFKAPVLAGGALDGTTFTGKPVAFWFWAPW